jgi:hypothetical protein
MSQGKGWAQVVKPFLTDKLNQSFPDPSKFLKEEEFVYAAKTSSVFKKVIAELLTWVEAQVAQAQFLKEKKKGLKDNFKIGS